MFPAADPAAIDLLKQMLQFNPSKRCTAEEALEHDFLKSVRKKEIEVRLSLFNSIPTRYCFFMQCADLINVANQIFLFPTDTKNKFH